MKLLLKIRLSHFFLLFFVVYLILAWFVIEGVTFEGGALTLFSVNSFLYGFYISPVLGAQKSRIDDLNKTIRAEANSLFSMLLKTKKLSGKTKEEVRQLFEDYTHASYKTRAPAAGEAQYEMLISYCLEYKGKDEAEVGKILDSLITNQQNRSQKSMLLTSKVFSNEWWIILVLFSITLGFILFLNVGDVAIMVPVKALLCTGLSMLLINLLKLSTLTHKKAKSLWDPFKRLLDTNYYSID